MAADAHHMGGLFAVLLTAMTGVSLPAAYDYHNVDASFWRVYDATKREPIEQRIAMLRDDIIRPNRSLYETGELPGSENNASLASYVSGIEPEEPQVRAIEQRLSIDLPADIATVEDALPNLSLSGVHVYVLPSLGAFDAEVHDLPDGVGVFFAPDGMFESGGPHPPIAVLVAHEFFHVYQFQMQPDFYGGDPVLWQEVWREGSAAYASAHIPAGATPAQALGPQLTNASREQVAQAACYIQTHWFSRNAGQIGALFGSSADSSPALLPNAGYLIGYLAAAQLAKTRTLAEIGSAPPAQVAPVLESTVDRFCAR